MLGFCVLLYGLVECLLYLWDEGGDALRVLEVDAGFFVGDVASDDLLFAYGVGGCVVCDVCCGVEAHDFVAFFPVQDEVDSVVGFECVVRDEVCDVLVLDGGVDYVFSFYGA